MRLIHIRVVLVSLTLFIHCCLFAQIAATSDTFNEYANIDQDSRIIILGESHVEINYIHKFELIKHFNNKRNFRFVGLEMTQLYEGLANEYIRNKCDDILAVLKIDYYKGLYYDTMALLEQIRVFNLHLAPDEQIEIFCYDIPSSSDMRGLRLALEYQYGGIPGIDSLNLFDILPPSNKKTSRIQAHAIVNSLKLDLKENFPKYVKVLGNKYEQYENLIADLEVSFPETVDLYSEYNTREEALVKNITKITSTVDSCIIVCGNNHAELAPWSIFPGNEPIRPLGLRLKSKYGDDVCSILTHYCYSNWRWIFGKRYSLFGSRREADKLLDKDRHILMIKEDNLPVRSYGKRRCDFMLMVNSRMSRKCANSAKHKPEFGLKHPCLE
jgi:hypothetical protein